MLPSIICIIVTETTSAARTGITLGLISVTVAILENAAPDIADKMLSGGLGGLCA